MTEEYRVMFTPSGKQADVPLSKVKEAQADGLEVAEQMKVPASGKFAWVPTSRIQEAQADGLILIEKSVPKSIINAIDSSETAQVVGEGLESTASGAAEVLNFPWRVGSAIGAGINEGINKGIGRSDRSITEAVKGSWNYENQDPDSIYNPKVLLPVQDFLSAAKAKVTSSVNPEEGGFDAQYDKDKAHQQSVKDNPMRSSPESLAGGVGTFLGSVVAPAVMPKIGLTASAGRGLANQFASRGANSSDDVLRRLSTKSTTSTSKVPDPSIIRREPVLGDQKVLQTMVDPNLISKAKYRTNTITDNGKEVSRSFMSRERDVATVTQEVPETVSSLLKNAMGVIKDFGGKIAASTTTKKTIAVGKKGAEVAKDISTVSAGGASGYWLYDKLFGDK